MKAAELLETRRENWRELDQLCAQMEGRSKRRLGAEKVARFAALYRSACADLALADAHQLPAGTIEYLHLLVGRAHNQLYLSHKFNLAAWTAEMLHELPQRLFQDNCLRLAFFAFWGVFLATMYLSYISPDFKLQLLGKEDLKKYEEMHNGDYQSNLASGAAGTGMYALHNGSIGLQCFAFGLLGGVGGLFVTISNALTLGAVFGHFASIENRVPFFQFVTAHGPFELTAIILAAGAGMRLGFALIFTGGWTRAASLRNAGHEAVPAACLSVVMFCLAGLIEAFISPSNLHYAIKAFIGIASIGIMVFYFVVLGYPREAAHAT